MTTNSKKMRVELEIDMEALPELMKLLVDKQGDLKRVEPADAPSISSSGAGINVSPVVPEPFDPSTHIVPYIPAPNSSVRPMSYPCLSCGWVGYPCKCSTSFSFTPHVSWPWVLFS